jgi:O-antigen/teichoic acid export membrane protein
MIFGATSVEVMQIVVWIFLFYFLSSLFTFTLIARSEQKKMLTINAIIALLNIVGNIIFIPMYSFIGSAWVTLVSQILLLILTLIAARKNIRFRDIWKSSIVIGTFAIL